MISRFRFSIVAIAFVILALNASTSFGWSFKEHVLFVRLAALRLLNDPSAPVGLKNWLRESAGEIPDMAGEENYFMNTKVGLKPEGFTGLSYWVYQPDIHALYDPQQQKVQPFGVHEKFLHYIDLELLIKAPDDFRRAYRHDLSGKPKLEDIPRDVHDPRYIQAGFLPFRTEQCYQELVKSIRENRLTARVPSEQEGKTALYWAGYLAHYLADATQPQHATMDYKSQSYFADKRKSPNIHAEVEYRMCDDDVEQFTSLRKEYWPVFVKDIEQFDDPVKDTDIWKSSVEVAWRSYDALPLIGLAAMHAAKQAGTPDHPVGPAAEKFDTEDFFHFRGSYMGQEMSVLEMKAYQTAWAVRRIENAFRQAWDESSGGH